MLLKRAGSAQISVRGQHGWLLVQRCSRALVSGQQFLAPGAGAPGSLTESALSLQVSRGGVAFQDVCLGPADGLLRLCTASWQGASVSSVHFCGGGISWAGVRLMREAAQVDRRERTESGVAGLQVDSDARMRGELRSAGGAPWKACVN